MAKRKILFVGAIGGMAYAARDARRAGYEVITADFYPDSQAKEYSDKSYLVSTLDVEALKKIVEDEGIEGIFTGYSDNNIRSTQKLCAHFGFPCYINEQQLDVMQNKAEFKKLCVKYGLPVPRSYEYGDEMEFPVIVKPSDAYGARGVTVCKDRKELEEAAGKALSLSRNEKLVIEDYLDGDEIMIHFVMLNGKLRLTSAYHRVLSTSFLLEKKSLAPLILYNRDSFVQPAMRYRDQLEQIFLDLGFENVVGFLQGIYCNDEIYFFEPAIRFGGNASEILNVTFNGVDIMRKFIDYAMTGVMDDHDIDQLDPHFDGLGCNLVFLLKPGTVTKIEGEKELFEMEEVKDVQRFCSIGDRIDENRVNAYSGVGYRLMIALDDRNKLQDTIEKTRKVLRVYDADGSDMINWENFKRIKFLD